MPRYQHNVCHVRGTQGSAGLCAGLDQLSAEGWEVLSVTGIMLQAGSQIAIPGQPAQAGEQGWEVVVRRPINGPHCTCEQSLLMG